MTRTSFDLDYWYLLGLKMNWSYAHKTRFWFLLGVSDDHPPTPFIWESPPPGLFSGHPRGNDKWLLNRVGQGVGPLIWFYLSIILILRHR